MLRSFWGHPTMENCCGQVHAEDPVGLCNIGLSIINSNLAKSHLFIKSNSVVESFWNFAQSTAVWLPCSAQFQNDWVIGNEVIGIQNFTRFGFKMSFGWISYIAQPPHSLFQTRVIGCCTHLVLSLVVHVYRWLGARLQYLHCTGSALDGAVFDIAQILAYLVHNMSRSQLYLGFDHFGWLPSFFGQQHFGGLMVKLYFLCWNYSLSSVWHIIAA